MSLMTWNSTLETGNAVIDSQHKKLISLINALNDAMKQGKGNQVLGQILTELIDYTHYHFQTEEKAFLTYHYPKAKAHKDAHDHLLKEVAEVKGKYDAGKIGITVPVLNFLVDWVQNHILKEDMLYRDLLAGKDL